MIFSDHHMTHRRHRHDYFFKFNFRLYGEMLRHYGDHGFALVENGDVEEVLIFEPTPNETKRRRALVKKPWVLDDIGEIDWGELAGRRIEARRKQLENILNDNREVLQIAEGMLRQIQILQNRGQS